MPASNGTQPQQLGDNITARVEGRKLIIEIDLDQDFGPSSSGKSITIASSCGNAAVTGTDRSVLGLNFYRPTRTHRQLPREPARVPSPAGSQPGWHDLPEASLLAR